MLNGVVSDNLQIILDSIILIEERFSNVDVPDKFVTSPEGVLLLDAVAMRLQVIGELTKKIHRIEPSLLEECPEIEWDKITTNLLGFDKIIDISLINFFNYNVKSDSLCSFLEEKHGRRAETYHI